MMITYESGHSGVVEFSKQTVDALIFCLIVIVSYWLLIKSLESIKIFSHELSGNGMVQPLEIVCNAALLLR